MVKWYKEQKRKYKDWHKYIGVWLKDQWSHIQLQDVLLLLIILGFIISLFAAKHEWLQLYHGSYTDRTEQLYLFSAIPQSLAAIFALTISLLLVALQQIGSNYTPRAIFLHTYSLYFILYFIIYIGTISYSIYLNGRYHDLPKTMNVFHIDLLILSFFFSLAFLIPFAIRTFRLIRPGFIYERLCWKITERRFNTYILYRKNVDRYLQPIFDITKACIGRADFRSIEEGFSFFSKRLSPFIRRSVSEASNSEIAENLFKHYLDSCYYATEKYSCTGCKIIIDSLDSILYGYEGSKYRSSVKIFRNFVERMEKDIEKFNDNIYEDRYMELHIALSNLRDTIIKITT